MTPRALLKEELETTAHQIEVFKEFEQMASSLQKEKRAVNVFQVQF